MKTDKYTSMLEAFECDLLLAKDKSHSLSELDKSLQDEDSRISKDLKLLEELSFLLRNGKAEIHLMPENAIIDISEKYKSKYVSLRKDIKDGLYDYARDAFHIEIGKLIMLSDIQNEESEEYNIQDLQDIWDARYYQLAYIKKEGK